MSLPIAQILGLGQAHSSFGITLALILTFIVVLGGVATALVALAIGQSLRERQQNTARARAYDAAHPR